MSLLNRLLSHRWLLAFLGMSALLFGLSMAHPYPRQSLFGPTIRGKPWCAWENAVRRYHTPDEEWPVWVRASKWLMDSEDLTGPELFDDAEMRPIMLKLAEDDDRHLRACILEDIRCYDRLRDRSMLPMLWRRLENDDQENRLRAAWLIWNIDKDRRIVPAFVRDLKNRSIIDCGEGVSRLGQMCREAPELIPHLLEYASDPDFDYSHRALDVGMQTGKDGIPLLTRCLDCPLQYVKIHAIWRLGQLGPDAMDAIPKLQQRLVDSDENVRSAAADALVAIDPTRFQDVKASENME